jgi:hypothetical protein
MKMDLTTLRSFAKPLVLNQLVSCRPLFYIQRLVVLLVFLFNLRRISCSFYLLRLSEVCACRRAYS